MELKDHLAPLPWTGMPPGNESVGMPFKGKEALIVL